MVRREWARAWTWQRSKGGGIADVGEAKGSSTGVGAGTARNGARVGVATSKGVGARHRQGCGDPDQGMTDGQGRGMVTAKDEAIGEEGEGEERRWVKG